MFFVRFVLFCADIVNDYLSKNCPYIAGAISFYTLFSMFPLFLAFVSGLGFVLGARTEQQQLDLARDVAEVLPISSAFVSERVEEVVSARAITGIASFFGLLWAATVAFGAIRKGINAAWGIRTPRPFLKERLIDFALVLGAGVLLLAVLFTGPALSILREITHVVAPESEQFGDALWRLLSDLLAPVLAFLTFLILYSFLPNTEVRAKHVWPWALLASLAFYAVNFGFVWYVRSYSLYNVVYGSIGAVLALLTWVYLSANIVLFGALVSSRYAEYVSSIPEDRRNFRLLWTGFTRVRLKVVESAGTA
jgi:membrane protein